MRASRELEERGVRFGGMSVGQKPPSQPKQRASIGEQALGSQGSGRAGRTYFCSHSISLAASGWLHSQTGLALVVARGRPGEPELARPGPGPAGEILHAMPALPPGVTLTPCGLAWSSRLSQNQLLNQAVTH